MKLSVLLVFFIGIYSISSGQNLSGQWKGEFLDKSTSSGSWGGDKCEYVLDLECKGNTVTGFSYTYFTDGGTRFYTICKLKGTLDKSKKYVEVREIERTKTNVPATIRNCFQVHRLNYVKTSDAEELEGKWVPAPDQDGNCGFGLTSLYRRALKSSFPNFNSSASKAPKTTAPKTNLAKTTTIKTTAPVAKKTPVAPDKKTPVATVAIPPKKEIVLTPNKGNMAAENIVTIQAPMQTITAAPSNFEKRNTTLLKTLDVDNETIKVELYDNGEIDGDSISVYYNKQLLLGKKRLTDKAITLTLPVGNDGTVNELVMFAENLGTIPPNTALMVVTDGTKRYEVRITSDLQKSGTIRFVHK